MAKILIVDDDILFSKTMQNNIYTKSDIIKNFIAILDLDLSKYKIILLDQNLPNILGTDLIKYFKSKDKIVIMITSSDSDELLSYKLGCDDYITKPISFEILNIKLKKHLKEINIVCYKDISLANFKINETIKLSKNEYLLLSYLIENNNKIIDKKTLIKLLWDNEEYILDTAFNTALMRLRKKLASITDVTITTIKNKGVILK